MLYWTIDIYSRVDDVLVEGVLYLISFEDGGRVWVEMKKPYSDLSIGSRIRNGGTVCIRGEWVDLNDPQSEITINELLAYMYRQCRQFDDHRDEIREMYNSYIRSSEYEPIEIREQIKRDLHARIIELEDEMDMDDPHDPNWKEHNDLWMRYDAFEIMNPMKVVDEIQSTFNIEGTRDFVISLIRKFIDEECDWC